MRGFLWQSKEISMADVRMEAAVFFEPYLPNARTRLIFPTAAWQWGRSGEYEHSNEIWTTRPREFGIRFLTKWGD